MKKFFVVLGAILALVGILFGVLALIERRGSRKPLTAIKGGFGRIKDVCTFAKVHLSAKAAPKD